jgi:hypothetical protein
MAELSNKHEINWEKNWEDIMKWGNGARIVAFGMPGVQRKKIAISMRVS